MRYFAQHLRKLEESLLVQSVNYVPVRPAIPKNQLQSFNTKKGNKMDKWKYIVWVGGVDDYYTDYKRAKEHYDQWIEQGYDDVILEKIDEERMESLQ